jgi:hypothetical protein
VNDPARFDAAKNLIHVGGERLVFHCHHYNLTLQRTVEDALGADAALVQQAAATESAERMLRGLFEGHGGDLRSGIDRAAEIFGALGFGKADVSQLGAEGGTVGLATSHYAVGYEAKFGKARSPVCFFAVGYWVAALAVAGKLPTSRLVGTEERCGAVQGGACEIRIEVL